MTDDERQRQMDFILQQQALLTATLEQFARKVDHTADVVASLFNIAGIHEREIGELRSVTKNTDERLNTLIETVERYIAGRNGQG